MYALEIDKKHLEYSLRNESFLKLWAPKVKTIFESLYRKDYFEDQFFKCSVLWGDAREKIKRSDAASVSYPTFWEDLAKLTN